MIKETNTRNEFEVSDMLTAHMDTLLSRYNLCQVQLKALRDLIKCRTAQAGGHIQICTNCTHTEHSYNSCRNRHCPKCQCIKQKQWGDKLKSRLIPGRYFHIVFTIPQELHQLFYINQQKCYQALFHAARDALLKAGRNPDFLGADVGAVAVLHTWGQTVSYHPHIHLLVPAGGLGEDGTEWVSSPKKFFVPVKPLSKIFRGILTRKLENGIAQQEITMPENVPGFSELKDQLYTKNWNVYCKKAFGGIGSVLEYLGKYSHRVAIANSRLISRENGKVKFIYRDYHNKGWVRTIKLDEIEFARRFLQHVLPAGFYKIRYFGMLASIYMHEKRQQSIAIKGKSLWVPVLEGISAYEILRQITKSEPLLCPACKKGMMGTYKDLKKIHQLE